MNDNIIVKPYLKRINRIAARTGILYNSRKSWGYSVCIRYRINKIIKKCIDENSIDNLLIIGCKSDLKYWKYIAEKEKWGIDESQFVSADDLFCYVDMNYPAETARSIICDEYKYIIVTENGSRFLEMLLLEWGVAYCNIFDYLSFSGIDLIDCNWNGHASILHSFRNAILVCAIPFISLFFNTGEIATFKQWMYYRKEALEGYEDIFVYKKKLKLMEEDQSLYDFYFKKLVSAVFGIKDFEELHRLIVEEVNNRTFSNEKALLIMLQGAEKLLAEEKLLDERLKQRQHQDIIFQWIDALPYRDFEEWGGLKDFKEKGFEFKYTYSSVPYTHPIEKIILTGGNYFKDKLNEKKELDDNCKLLNILKSNGYSYHSFGKSMVARPQDTLSQCFIMKDTLFQPAPLLQWLAKVRIVHSESKCFCLIHNCMETHTPFFSQRMEGNYFPNRMTFGDDKYNENRKNSFLDLERHLLKTQGALNDKYTTSIYMSDHGRGDSSLLMWKDIRSRAFCFAYGGTVKRGSSDDFFQFERMSDFIKCIIQDENDYTCCTTEYAKLMGEDTYSARRCNAIVYEFQTSTISEEDLGRIMQYRGVCTKDYKFVKNPVREYQYDMPNETLSDEIIDEEHKRLIDDFEDITINDRYQFTMKMYEALGVKTYSKSNS